MMTACLGAGLNACPVLTGFPIFERLLPGSRVSCRDAGSTALSPLLNPRGRSTTQCHCSTDHYLSLPVGNSFYHLVLQRKQRNGARSALAANRATGCRLAKYRFEQGNSGGRTMLFGLIRHDGQ